MKLFPDDLFSKIEFDKVIALLKKECYGELGKVYFDALMPETDLFLLEKQLNEVKNFKELLEKGESFPLAVYSDLYEELKFLNILDSVLPLDSLQEIYKVLSITRAIFSFFSKERQETYPFLFSVIRTLSFEKGLTDAIEKVLDPEGNLRPDASPELLRINRARASRQKEIDKEFRKLVNQFRQSGWLTDNEESIRNGRRVLSVPAEHKRKIRGIIHDESATGKTAFIEPEAIIEFNNDLFDLEQEEKREVYRILKTLCNELRVYVPLIRNYQTLLLKFDVIQAKGRLAYQMKASKPKMTNEPAIGIIKGRHPLLLLKNQAQNKLTVPFDMQLFGSNRILVLSGPNAGGKSIAMKAVGLMQIMLQCGLLIPVDASSEMGLFEEFFADIGDQQSLEDELSTYSSHLMNMKYFMENCTLNSLLLIDEFGSGTDPKIGGAIAEAFLHTFHEKKVYAVITTHYSNLKVYAFKNKGIVNGAMAFDKDTLSPTYNLQIGRPGSSYAFEIAQKTGLNNSIINYAKHKSGKSTKAVDQLLIDLQQEKKELEEKLDAIIKKEKNLDRLIKNYEHMHKELDVSRKKLKLEIKEQALLEQNIANKELENLIRELREKNKLEEARKLAVEVKESRKQIVEEVQVLTKQVYYEAPMTQALNKELEEGDFVRMKTGSATGKVERIQKNFALVLFGEMKMKVKLHDLVACNEPLESSAHKNVKVDTHSNPADTFESKLDIRGMRMSDAIRVVENYVDQALLANAALLQIVHGKGNGVLRKVVRQKLREYDAIKRMEHPASEQGGDGVTIAYLS